MAQPVGTLLWQLRTAGGWSLGQVARRAGLSTAALSRWESGDRLPRLPELEAALQALGASASQSSLALASLDAPRALRRLRAPTETGALGAPPMAGDLLHAMRQRGGWTQVQIATRIGVGQNTMARWERGERLPSNEQMQALCFALDARDEEIIALTTDRFAETPDEMPLETEAVRNRLWRTLTSEDLGDLRFLTLERALWQHAAQNESAQPLLADAYAHHAQFLNNHGHWAEAGAMARRALALTAAGQDGTLPIALRAAIHQAMAAVYGGSKPAPARGLHLLKTWLPRATPPDYAAWMLGDMAKYAAMAGQADVGVRLAEKAVQISIEDRNLRRIDQGRVLLAAGIPGEALSHLPDLPEKDSDVFVFAALVRVEAHQRLEEWAEAHDWLQRIYSVIATYHLERLRPQADALAQRL